MACQPLHQNFCRPPGVAAQCVYRYKPTYFHETILVIQTDLLSQFTIPIRTHLRSHFFLDLLNRYKLTYFHKTILIQTELFSLFTIPIQTNLLSRFTLHLHIYCTDTNRLTFTVYYTNTVRTDLFFSIY